MKLLKDLGMRYTPGGSIRKFRYGLYLCPYCKEEIEAVTSNVKRSKTGRCTNCKFITNDKKNNPEYDRWNNMLQRCYNSKAPNFKDYGGRGIKVFLRWKQNFKKYNAYILSLPDARKAGRTIDRIDNDKGYFPGNLRWATRSEQSHNTRIYSNNVSGITGVQLYKHNGKWRAGIKVKGKTIHLGYYIDKRDAIKARKDAEKRYLGDKKC